MNIETTPKTFEDLYILRVNRNLREQNVGFTVTPATYRLIRNIIQKKEEADLLENPSAVLHRQESFVKFPYFFAGIQIIIVQTQIEPIISWSDEKEMKDYIEKAEGC